MLQKGQKHKLNVIANSKVEIPFVFKPKEVLNYESVVSISIN